jgi:hypothetical protein
VNWTKYPSSIDHYRPMVLREEQARRPKHERLYDPTRIAQQSSSAMRRKELGRWRHSPSQYYYGPASGDLPRLLDTVLMCFRRSIRRLNTCQQAIDRLYYPTGWSQQQVATHLDCSRRCVRQLLDQVPTTIRHNILKQKGIGHLLSQRPPARWEHYCRDICSADTTGTGDGRSQVATRRGRSARVPSDMSLARAQSVS